jgi:hypothetical protein
MFTGRIVPQPHLFFDLSAFICVHLRLIVFWVGGFLLWLLYQIVPLAAIVLSLPFTVSSGSGRLGKSG